MEKQLNMISFWLQGVSEVLTVFTNQGILSDYKPVIAILASRVDRSTMNFVGLLVGMDKLLEYTRSP